MKKSTNKEIIEASSKALRSLLGQKVPTMKELYGSMEFSKEELEKDDGLTFHERWEKWHKKYIEKTKKKYKFDHDNQRDASAESK